MNGKVFLDGFWRSSEDNPEQFGGSTGSVPALSFPKTFLRTRFLQVAGVNSASVAQGMRRLFGYVDLHQITEKNLRGFSQADTGFEILVIGMDAIDDLRDVCTRPLLTLIRQKLSVCFTPQADPSLTATIFQFGFDDVFTPEMEIEEAQARLASLIARRKVYADHGAS